MKLLSDRSYATLVNENSLLKERNQALSKRVRQLEHTYQKLVLLVGLKGLEVELKPPVPAKPATLRLKTSRKS